MYVTMQGGWIEVICGSMFSGKSEELIRRVRRSQFAKQKIAVFKPEIDDRYSEEAVVSHNGTTVIANPVASSAHIEEFVTDEYDVIAIDEAQFFDEGIVDTVMESGRPRIPCHRRWTRPRFPRRTIRTDAASYGSCRTCHKTASRLHGMWLTIQPNAAAHQRHTSGLR